MEEDKILTGVVSHWNYRGYGFVTPDAGSEDIFVHESGVIGTIKIGDKVSFELSAFRGRPVAKSV